MNNTPHNNNHNNTVDTADAPRLANQTNPNQIRNALQKLPLHSLFSARKTRIRPVDNRFRFRWANNLKRIIRGQSGFDNSGRGYYFATDEDESDRSRGYGGYSYSRPSSSMSSSPCGRISGNCPYAGGSKVTSSAIGSDSSRVGGHTNVLGSEGGPGSWTYLGDQDKVGGSSGSSNGSGGSSSSSSGGSSSGSSGSGGSRERERERERDRERDAQR